MDRLKSVELLPEVFPAWLHQYGSIREDDGWNASIAIVDILYELSGFIIPFQSHAEVGDVIGFKEFLCAYAIRAVFGCVHHDLGWSEGVKIGHFMVFVWMMFGVTVIQIVEILP